MAAYLYSHDDNPLRLMVAVDLADAIRIADHLSNKMVGKPPDAIGDFNKTTYDALWAVKEVADEMLTVRPPERSPFDSPPEWDDR